MEAKCVNVVTYSSNKTVDEESRCYLMSRTENYTTTINLLGGRYMSPSEANSLIKAIATKDFIDLDEYEMGFYESWDEHPHEVSVTNSYDFELNPIPLEICMNSFNE